MKKIIPIIALIILLFSINKTEKVTIPKESIRFRIIASSNTEIDQNVKKEILKNLSQEIVETKKFTDITETRNYLKDNISEFTKTVEKTLKSNNYDKNFNISYGKNYFPRKEYKDVIYEEGMYESLVITIGDGKGKNFWCVLFPPLCMIDENNDIEYKSLIKETIDKYF